MGDAPAHNTRHWSANKQNFKAQHKLSTNNDDLQQDKCQAFNLLLSRKSNRLDAKKVKRIKERARRLSASDTSLNISPKLNNKRAKSKRNKSEQSEKTSNTDQSIKKYTNFTRKDSDSNMSTVSEVLTQAHSVLDMEQNNCTQAGATPGIIPGEATSASVKSAIETSTQGNEITFNHGNTSEPLTPPIQPSTDPDYSNMSNAHMIKLFMDTVTNHKEELKSEIRKHLYQYLRDNETDIALLQETHFTKDLIKNVETETGCATYNSFGNSKAGGVSIVIGRKFERHVKIQTLYQDTQGRLIICKLTTESCVYVICNIYGHNEDKVDLFAALNENLKECNCENIIIGGDFNFVLDDTLDAKNRNASHPRVLKYFQQLCDDHDHMEN